MRKFNIAHVTTTNRMDNLSTKAMIAIVEQRYNATEETIDLLLDLAPGEVLYIKPLIRVHRTE